MVTTTGAEGSRTACAATHNAANSSARSPDVAPRQASAIADSNPFCRAAIVANESPGEGASGVADAPAVLDAAPVGCRGTGAPDKGSGRARTAAWVRHIAAAAPAHTAVDAAVPGASARARKPSPAADSRAASTE